MRDKLNFVLNCLKEYGADKASCRIDDREKQEINVESGKITLMRSSFDAALTMTAIIDNRQAVLTSNNLEPDALKASAAELCETARASQPDEANDISLPEDGETAFVSGPCCDKDKLYDRLTEFVNAVQQGYPLIQFSTVCSFDKIISVFGNSNNVFLQSDISAYDVNITFSAKDGDKSSSMTFFDHVFQDLDTPFIEVPGVRDSLSQSIEHLNPRSIQESFVGDIVLAPSVVPEFSAYFLMKYLGDATLIEGKSPLMDKLGQQVVSSLITLCDRPEDIKLQFITSDGYRAVNTDYIKDGQLQSYALSLYGAKKTGLKRAKSYGSFATVLPGETPLEELIAGVKQGILLYRFSGGNPNDAGDLSGVAKNSFYIENGKVAYPVNETMISGNLLEIFNNVIAVSQESLKESGIESPWIRVSGVSVVGK